MKTWLLMILLLPVTMVWSQEPVKVPVPRPEPLIAMDLGGGLSSYIISSHLQTGWARYLQTVPATVLRDGIGSWTACQQIQKPEDAEAILGPLHDYGMGVFRVEIGWGSTEYRDDLTRPLRLTPGPDANYRAILKAAKKHGFRLVVLLNAHQGMPCPAVITRAVFTVNAEEGAREITLTVNDARFLRPGYSGLSNFSDYCAAESLFLNVTPQIAAGNNVYTIRLANPLCKAVPAGTQVDIATLQYRPFGCPTSDDETYQGWGEYAELLAKIAAEEGLQDGDADFEIWNELTFGTKFLSIKNYDEAIPGEADRRRMLSVAAGSIRRIFPERSVILNGFSNTSFFFEGFWSGSKPGVNGETYHPYGNQWRQYPEEAKKTSHLVEGYRNVDGFVPKYTTLYPEYRANFETSHSLMALMQSQMRDLLVKQGHAPNGWKQAMTEDGLFLQELNLPAEYKARLDANPEHYVAKYWLRLYPFYLNKGLYAVCDGSLRNPSDWDKSWEADFARTKDLKYLKALEPVKRMAALVKDAKEILPEKLLDIRLEVTQLSGQDLKVFDTAGAYICPTGAESRPWNPTDIVPQPLYYRDVFCFLPFQIDDDSIALAVYIQTRNILDDVTDAGTYRIALSTLQADIQNIRVTDSLTGEDVPVELDQAGVSPVITMTLTDTPRWIIIDGVIPAK